MVGCDCAVCTSADPRDNRTRSSIYVSTPGCAWVIDTGPEFPHTVPSGGHRPHGCSRLYPSHTDHMMGFDDLRPFLCEWPGAARVRLGGDDGGFASASSGSLSGR